MIKRREALDGVPLYRLPDFSRKNKSRLDLNENARGCSAKVLEAIKKIKAEEIATYPEYDQLIEKIAAYHELKPANILLTNGGDEAIRCIMDTYLERGDEVLIPEPTYSMYEILGRLHEAKLVKVAYGTDFLFPQEDFLKAINQQTKVIIVVNPNSPTGTSLTQDGFKAIMDKARDCLVILDESYSHFVRASWTQLIRDYENLVVIQTFSKAFGLAGLRLGYLVSDEKNIESMLVTRLPFSVNSLAVVAGCASLDDQAYIREIVEHVESEKKVLYDALNDLGVEVLKTDTNFLLVNMGDDSSRIYDHLLQKGILVKNLDESAILKGYFRVTVGTHGENLVLIEVLKELLLPQAILFDMDGVLVDVRKSYRVAIQQTAEHFLKEKVGFEEIAAYKLKGGYNNDWFLTQTIINSRGVRVSQEQVMRRFQEFYLGQKYDGLIANEKWLLDESILKRLKQNHKLGIVTGRPRQEAEYCLKRFGMDGYFDVLIAMEDVEGKDKPEPYGINLALKKLDVKRAIYVGDDIDDIRAALLAKITSASVVMADAPDAERAIGRFQRTGSRHILNSVNEIGEVLR